MIDRFKFTIAVLNMILYPIEIYRQKTCALEGLDLFLEMVDTLLQALHMRLNGRRGQLPFRWGKGKSPGERVGFGLS